jgi:glycosyltransferase involved in cell wall biosynthesis
MTLEARNASIARKQTRILCVIRWPVGGIRTYLLYNFSRLADVGYRFTFLGPDDDSFTQFAKEVEDWPGVEFARASIRGRSCQIWPEIRRLLKTSRFDLIHSQGLTATVSAAISNWGRYRVPHVATSHDVIHPEQFDGWVGRSKLWLIGWILSHVDVLITVSKDTRLNHLKWLPRLGRQADRVITIINGIDLTRCEPLSTATESCDLRRRLGIGPDVTIIGFLGRFMRQKGFLLLLDAIQRLIAREPNLGFRVVAIGSGDYEREYQRQVQRRALDHVVCFLPSVRFVREIIGYLDLLVVPSLWEACPLLPMEAMVFGIPVLGSDCIGLREVLDGTPARLFKSGNVDELADALHEAIIRPWTVEARAFASEARRRFDVAVATEALLRTYDRVLNGSCRTASEVSALGVVDPNSTEGLR